MKQALFAAVAALFIVGAVSAQEKDPQKWQTAKDRIENMAQYVKMDEATTQKVTEAMYKYVVAQSDASKDRASMTPEEWREANNKRLRAFREETTALLNAEQDAGYRQWMRLPIAERYKKISK